MPMSRVIPGCNILRWAQRSCRHRSAMLLFVLETQRISELLLAYVDAKCPGEEQLRSISTYIDLLLRWNQHVNLSAIRDAEQIVCRHFGESLFAARNLFAADSEARVIDVGSGAGFPGMVLKIFAPALRLTLIESQGKKAVFLRELARALKFSDVRVVQERAERFAEQAEVVTFRAVERFERILLSAAALVSPGGRLGALIGASQLGIAAEVLPGDWKSLPIPASHARVLAMWPKPGE